MPFHFFFFFDSRCHCGCLWSPSLSECTHSFGHLVISITSAVRSWKTDNGESKLYITGLGSQNLRKSADALSHHCKTYTKRVAPRWCLSYSKLAFRRTCCRKTSSLISLRTCQPTSNFFEKNQFWKYVKSPILQERARQERSLTLRTSSPGSEILRSSKRELTVSLGNLFACIQKTLVD